ncbi:hypothetical protein EW145_g317 [Phellinidium pouzarii]|uniref:C2H2-type domain-containing protein n=1 Tax=Phellinidium pouzarii TaxID=167371 RepID=A0A4S4LKL8_9AGAM|nr:hypothetical protein EW145_g317 [Phellinidium pouzarii]
MHNVCSHRRLTQFFPCDVKTPHETPLLTSRVQWSAENANSERVPVSDDFKEKDEHLKDSPVLSEIVELMSECEHSSADSHPPQGLREHVKTPSQDDGSVLFRSDAPDTETRTPHFPGDRDIIDRRYPSTSPTPPSQHSSELQTPSPVGNSPKDWKPSYSESTSSALDLRLSPHLPSRDERNTRIGSWRLSSAPENYRYGQAIHGHYSSHSDLRRMEYSPSISTSSVPPSPPTKLPSIHHLNATLPVNTGCTPGVLHWHFRESMMPGVKPSSPFAHDSIDERDMIDSPSSLGSPQVLPPLLPHILSQTYSPCMQTAPSILMVGPTQPTDSMRNKNAWKDHTQLVRGPNNQTEFRCVWRIGHAGETTDLCGYTAKRHLVKRHIETRHLEIKNHICPFCAKAFPQRVSLNIHVNRHTGATPHPCRYGECDKKFSDPARRHKHMVEAHGYNPQGPRKRYRTTDSYHNNSHFETLAPWTATSNGAEGRVVSG